MRWPKAGLRRAGRAATRPARLTGPTPLSSSSRAWRSRSASGSAQWVTGKRPPNGSPPLARRAVSFARRSRISSFASSGFTRSPRVPLPFARPPSLSFTPADPEQIRPDQLVEVAVHHRLDVADLDPRPMVLDELVGMERVRANLAPEGDLLLGTGELGELPARLLVPDPVGPPFGESHRRVAV